ncbi:NAD-dependent DNA ligase LigA, partial [Patescibacteria group bacterium]|nr:NAD-dependent DNA ligase LigA [Patescibacteria group bacterium]
MTKKEATKRIAQLRKTINFYSYQYHVLDKLNISDAAWDSLKHELKQLEDAYPDLITPDSPTQRVSGQPLDKFVKVGHKEKMLSLEDAFSPEEVAAWQKRIKKLLPREKMDYFAELKVDGFAISLVYKNGVLATGSTRGDGKTGEDVTQNLKTIESIPLKLEIRDNFPDQIIRKKIKALLKKGEIEIRGEVYMTKSAFKKVNAEREKENQPLYANPRNTAAGSIRQLDPKIAASRQLNFLAYDLVSNLGQKTHQEKHQIARALGFKTDEGKYCRHLDDIIAFWKRVEKAREKIPFQIDGLVVQVNSINLFEKLGVVGKAPRGAIAFKFAPSEATTVIEDIVIQVGRTGALTPVAKLRPVKIGGVLVTRATLHNEDEIKRLDVRIGDTVSVQRAGDVIPDVVEVIKKMRTGKEKRFTLPKKCPICGGPVVRPAGEAVHRCVNKKCAVVQKRQISHFASRNAFDIDGLGPKIIAQLMNEGLIVRPSDIFTLQEGNLIPLERFDQKSADNLINAIKDSRQITLARLIYSLGIRHVGEETAIN